MINKDSNTKLYTIVLLSVFLITTLSVYSQQNNNEVKAASLSYIKRLPLPAELDETSGLMFWDNRLWSHNDSGGSADIYAFNPDNPAAIEAYVTGVPNRDWEAIDQDEDYIYIGDFGNNGLGNRQDLRIFRIGKQSLLNKAPVADTIFFAYPEQIDFTRTPKPESTNFDCEAFIVTHDSIFLFTKRWLDSKTSLYSLPKKPGNYFAQYITTYDINGLVTDAAYLPEKRILALSGYSSSYLRQFIYIFYDFKGRNFFDGKKYNFTLNMGVFPHQTEGLATKDGNIYYVTNEYKSVSPQRLHTFNVTNYFTDYMLRPETAVKIDGPVIVCQDNRSVNYSVKPIHNAVRYEWTLSDGITGHSYTNNINVHFDATALQGSISVRAVNEFGYGGITNLSVNLREKPATPEIYIADIAEKILQSSAKYGNQWYNQFGMIKGATSQQYKVTEYGEYYVMVTSGGCTSSRSNVIITDNLVDPHHIPVLTPDSIKNPGTDPLHDYSKNVPVKKKRRFLFWRF